MTCSYQCSSVSQKSRCTSVTACLLQAKHMKSIRRCWNVLRGSAVDLLRRDGCTGEDRSAGKWVSVVSQLVMVSAGLHHLAAELVPHQHLLQFHTTKCLDYCFVKFLNDIKTKQKAFKILFFLLLWTKQGHICIACLMLLGKTVHCLDSTRLQWTCVRKVCSQSNFGSRVEPKYAHTKKLLMI